MLIGLAFLTGFPLGGCPFLQGLSWDVLCSLPAPALARGAIQRTGTFDLTEYRLHAGLPRGVDLDGLGPFAVRLMAGRVVGVELLHPPLQSPACGPSSARPRAARARAAAGGLVNSFGRFGTPSLSRWSSSSTGPLITHSLNEIIAAINHHAMDLRPLASPI